MLLFDEDLQRRQHITATFLRAQALLGLGRLLQRRLHSTRCSALIDPTQRRVICSRSDGLEMESH